MAKTKTIFFPFGIFLLSAVLFSGGGAAGSVWYFYVASKKEIAETERFTQSSLVPVLDACVQMAELDGGKESAKRLNALFRDYRLGNIVAKAFFVRENGLIVSHSDQNEVKELKGNIAADEFTYNIDQIFRPIRKNLREPYFDDYFMVEKKIPFDRQTMGFLKKHLYDGIDRNGWILSRQVIYKGKTAGVIAFFSDKDTIYERIAYNMKECIFWMKMSAFAGVGLAFIFSMIVFVRYQMIYYRATRREEKEDFPPQRELPLPEIRDAAAAAVSFIPEALPSEPAQMYTEYEVQERAYTDFKAPVQDAIPVRKK